MLLHAKVLNTQLEGDFGLTCLGMHNGEIQYKPLHDDDEDNDKSSLPAMSISPLILQSSQLEDSNFKDQFFVTRSSFQVNYVVY